MALATLAMLIVKLVWTC